MDIGGLIMVLAIAAFIPIVFGRGNWKVMAINWLIGSVALIVSANLFFAILGADAAQADKMIQGWAEMSRDLGQPSGPGRLEWYIQAYLPVTLTLLTMTTCQGFHLRKMARPHSV